MLDVLKRDPREVEKMILNLSDIYRKTLMMPDSTRVPLKDELTLVKEYLEIEKVRMGDRLTYSFQVDDQLSSFKLPPMMIQILVENAIKHGLSPKKEGGDVRIQATRSGDTVTLEVIDTGVGFDVSEPSSGFGLPSIEDRLNLLYQNAKMEILGQETGGTCVRICLPDA